MLEHIATRLNNAKMPFIFAIPEDDELLTNYLSANNFEFCKGDHYNVLNRFVKASENFDGYIIRLTADNPFTDIDALKALLNECKKKDADYGYTVGLPLGMGSEVIKASILHDLKKKELQPHHNEHVTIYLRENPTSYHIVTVQPYSQNMNSLRITIDETQDLLFARTLYSAFIDRNKPLFNANDVYKLYIEQPGIFSINSQVQQKSAKSFDERASVSGNDT